MVKPADFSGRWRGACVAAGLLLGVAATSPAWAEVAAMSDNPAGETPAVSVGLAAAESDLGNTQAGQGPAVGADSAAPGSVDAAPADGDAAVVPPASSDTVSGDVNSVPSGGSDASGDASAPDGDNDNAADDDSDNSDNEQVGNPVVPAHEAVLSQNPYGMFDVSLSFKAEYSSRTLFGKTTTDYTKGGKITCKLSKWVQGSGLYGEPADFKYTKTDASGQTVAFDGAPEAVVSEDGTLVWTVGGLDPRDAATLEAGTTYTITFRVFARDLAYSS